MEITTLEQYILNELDEKKEELEETCVQLANLSVSYKMLMDKYDKLMRLMEENLKYRPSSSGKPRHGYYSMYIWYSDPEFDEIDELFHQIREQVEEDDIEDEIESGEAIREDSKDSVSENS